MKVCEECGYPLDSREHKEGVGLHGHKASVEAAGDLSSVEPPPPRRRRGS